MGGDTKNRRDRSFSPLRLTVRFAFHVLIGAVIFFLVAFMAMIIDLFAGYLHGAGAPDFVLTIAKSVALFIFGVDAVCAIFFVITESVIFVKLVWNLSTTSDGISK